MRKRKELRVGVICWDLDGTLAEDTWPDPRIGAAIPEAIEAMKKDFIEGSEIVVYTARPQSHTSRIWEWLQEQNLDTMVYDVITGKPVADKYRDDKAEWYK